MGNDDHSISCTIQIRKIRRRLKSSKFPAHTSSTEFFWGHMPSRNVPEETTNKVQQKRHPTVFKKRPAPPRTIAPGSSSNTKSYYRPKKPSSPADHPIELSSRRLIGWSLTSVRRGCCSATPNGGSSSTASPSKSPGPRRPEQVLPWGALGK